MTTAHSDHSSAPRPVRRTLAAPARCAGVTLFTGVQSSVVLLPREGATTGAAAGGLEFRRVDLPGAPGIPARAANITPDYRRTVIAADPASPASPSVQTTEHLLSALAGLGITDAIIEVSGPELPIGDGSARIFVEAILAAGVREIASPDSDAASPLVIKDPIFMIDDKSGASIQAMPHTEPGLRITYELAYPPGFPIPPQSATLFLPLGGTVHNYVDEIAPARTFSLQQEAEAARKMGLFAHLSPRDMLVIGAQGPIDNAYRFDNEPARHKLLDALGDLALSGRLAGEGGGIQAHIICKRTGHAHNHMMARAISRL